MVTINLPLFSGVWRPAMPPRRSPGGDPGENSLLRCQPARGDNRVLVADRDDSSTTCKFRFSAQNRRPCLDFVRAGLDRLSVARLGDDRRILRLDGEGTETLLGDLITSATPVRFAGADGGNQDVRLSLVSDQISSAVVRRWISGFGRLLNCWGIHEPAIPCSSPRLS